MIQRRGKAYLIKDESGRVVGATTTRADAKAYERALLISKRLGKTKGY